MHSSGVLNTSPNLSTHNMRNHVNSSLSLSHSSSSIGWYNYVTMGADFIHVYFD